MFNVKIDLHSQEEIIHQGGANHFMNGEAVGGKLFLTNQRLYYKSHGLNLQNHDLTMQFSEIKKLELCKTMYIVPNGLKIHLSNGNVEQFVVQKRKKWLELIEEKI